MKPLEREGLAPKTGLAKHFDFGPKNQAVGVLGYLRSNRDGPGAPRWPLVAQ
jgi:hypothetical protein